MNNNININLDYILAAVIAETLNYYNINSSDKEVKELVNVILNSDKVKTAIKSDSFININ